MLGACCPCLGWLRPAGGGTSTRARDAGPSKARGGVGIGKRGPQVQVGADGRSISGRGSALGASEVLQDRAYWEVTIASVGDGGASLRIGVATSAHNTDAPLALPASEPKAAATSWAHELGVAARGTPSGGPLLAEGDVVGCALDQGDFPVTLRVLHAGRQLAALEGVRGEVFPAVSIGGSAPKGAAGAPAGAPAGAAEAEAPAGAAAGGACLFVNLGDAPLSGPQPDGFDALIASKSLFG